MKVFLFLFLVSTSVFSQLENDQGQIIWRSVKQYNGSAEVLFKKFKSSGKFSSLEILDESIIGNFTDVPIRYKGAASMYLMASNLNGSFVVEFKENRYRITAKNLKFESQTSAGVFDQGSQEAIEKYALNSKGELRKRFKSKDTPIIEDSLSNAFDLRSGDDDW
ncbi:hypothetical protein [Cytophaga sp. FL35]|uniref:hypothetical protein n=1 Tax=Cytophaga sp. FL35 TaxID=1904456 RepID=UPI001653A5E8|nr:hypothetical protein [Cytophaga sp. FL35]MBC7000859.1 hypothetical protein [Cytophaga sp. FL35]